MMCIKCKIRKAGATPSLCLSCFRAVGRAVFTFFHARNPLDEERNEARLKNWLNRCQRKSRQAAKRYLGR